MAQRITKPKPAAKREEPVAEATEAVDTERAERLKAELDDILDDIDEVLEENAVEFVAGYVQKGGE